MKITSFTFNLFTLITVPLSLWLAFSGRVDWWVIIFVWLMACDVDITLGRRRD